MKHRDAKKAERARFEPDESASGRATEAGQHAPRTSSITTAYPLTTQTGSSENINLLRGDSC